MTSIKTHHWKWILEINNEFRNSHCKIEHRYYSPLAFFFEAGWSTSGLELKNHSENKITISISGKETVYFFNKEEAIGYLKKSMKEIPSSCKEYLIEEQWAILDTIYGKKNWNEKEKFLYENDQ